MYAKLIEGRLVSAPAMIRTELGDVYHPTPDILTEAGYKPVIGEPYPETDEESPVVYEERFTVTENEIVRSWVEHTDEASEVE